MISKDTIRAIAGVAGVILAIVTIVWSVVWLWQSVAEIDRNPNRGGLMEQMMHRKSDAMRDILDGMIRGDLSRVETAAGQMAAYGKTAQWYVSSAEYQTHGEGFRGAVDDLRVAAHERDMKSAKEATLRLERSCLECHALMNQRTHE